MQSNLIATEPRCDLIRLERTNMVTKMEDRVKVDLISMSKLILDEIRLCNPDSLANTPEMISQIAVQFNQGSLVQYQYGEIEKAEALCHGEIELFARLSSCSSNRALCLANMVPPYINLARIYGQKGEVRESLCIFEEIYRFSQQQQDLSIFGHRILASDGPAMFAAAPGYQKVMLSCRVVEAARVFHTLEDYPALLALVEANKDLPEFQDTFFKQYLLEIQTRALLHMGQYEMAMEALEKCSSLMPLNTTDRIVVHCLLSQIYREGKHHDLARQTLDKLEKHLGEAEKFVRKLPVLRQVAYRLALERHLLGDESKALAPAEKAFQWCNELSDQPGSIKSAILLLRISSNQVGSAYSPKSQRYWYDQLQQLASMTFFRLDRACAYWELGLSAELLGSGDAMSLKFACELLRNSYELYRPISFVDSRQSCEAVKRSLDCRMRELAARTMHVDGMVEASHSSIDSVFDLLMEYVPKAAVASQ
jgi:tetratricopeptide (TPR) repeat protein